MLCVTGYQPRGPAGRGGATRPAAVAAVGARAPIVSASSRIVSNRITAPVARLSSRHDRARAYRGSDAGLGLAGGGEQARPV